MFLTKLCLLVFAVETANYVSLFVNASRETANSATGTFRFANIYGDHMVLQAKPFSAMVWGFGEIGQTVDVRFGNEFLETKVIEGSSGSGVWKVTLDAQDAGGPYTINASSKVGNTTSSISLADVLFGDVWLCSGQSNMAFTVTQVVNASEAIEEADHYPDIRLFTASLIASDTPLYELQEVMQPWSVASSKSVNGGAWKYFSAVCWFYGKNIYHQYKKPIGLIATDWGGTPVESWSSPDALRQCNITGDKVVDVFVSPEEEIFKGPYTHSALYNAMIHPFLNMTIYGAIWYQGEANAAAPFTYNCTFPAMIDDWRSKWFYGTDKLTDPEFPFGFVQLSSFYQKSKVADGFPVIRWAQTANYGYAPNLRERNVFMAVAMDLGNKSAIYGSIHPPDKQDVGFRLALAGRAVAYDDLDVYFSGPIVSDVTFSWQINTTFWKANVKYHHESVGKGGIEVRALRGFQYYCVSSSNPADSMFTEAEISTSAFNMLGLSGECPSGYQATGLRYAWNVTPCEFKNCAVYSKENELPSPPFVWNAPDVQPTK